LREHADELDTLNKDLQVAKQVAETANREKSAFLSNMSHELRTPLNAILGFAQILNSDMLPSTAEEKKEYANEIYRAGTHLLTLINEILDLAKVESGTLSMSLEAVTLAEVFDSCRTMVEPLAKKRNISISFPTQNDLNLVADRTRLKQVLINLLSNAIKYNHEGGDVAIECEPATQDCVRILVRDTGVGLDAKQLSAIFQPFNRLGRESSNEEGTGLGLALTKRLVEAMHGSIGVSSTVGKGSTFWIELQVTEAIVIRPGDRMPKMLTSANASQDPATRKTLLYVEDNPNNLKLVTELIRLRADLQLFTATDGYTGIELARRHMPHAILMDINLPGIDGIETLKILRDDPKTAHIPVIAVTANAMPADVRKGMAAGFFRYMTKPIDIDMFSEAIDSALELNASRCNV
jgi:CheY-like chemotaxis protein/two-component sensor histidine kinase